MERGHVHTLGCVDVCVCVWGGEYDSPEKLKDENEVMSTPLAA